MNRRGFLRLLSGAIAAAAAPTKTYAFFGGILRPRPVDQESLWLIGWSEKTVWAWTPGVCDWRFHGPVLRNIDTAALEASRENGRAWSAHVEKVWEELHGRQG